MAADEYALQALRSGASGLLGKSVEPEELLDAVRVVARAEALQSPRSTCSPTPEREIVALVARVAHGPGNDDIAARLHRPR